MDEAPNEHAHTHVCEMHELSAEALTVLLVPTVRGVADEAHFVVPAQTFLLVLISTDEPRHMVIPATKIHDYSVTVTQKHTRTGTLSLIQINYYYCRLSLIQTHYYYCQL